MSDDLEIYIKKIIEFGKKEKVLINPVILELIIKNNYTCVCKLNTSCPCKEAPEEIKEKGRCHCGLFIKNKD